MIIISLIISVASIAISIASINNLSKAEKMLDEYRKRTEETQKMLRKQDDDVNPSTDILARKNVNIRELMDKLLRGEDIE
ncbi:hypothetical protein [Bacteroides acidifaciens]|uniref:hypothetical protein n=1 Tax=Bacteroides acidifaciens TaxID=85831 RepID=UPI00263B4B98|nr:hypothetical protein [Bacteroides acidifaciens]